MTYFPVEIMETDSTRNVGRTELLGELGAALAARETDPTPVVTRSSEINRAEPTCRSGSRIPTGNRNPTGSKQTGGNSGFHVGYL